MKFEILLLTVILPCFVYPYPEGAPCRAREDMTPNHKGGKRDQAPYRLRFTAPCYQPGISYKVLIQPKRPDVSLRGFVLQARTIDTVGRTRAGDFIKSESKDWKYQCPDEKNSVTHRWKDAKKEIVVDWSIDKDVGPIRFVATVVQSYSSFWVQGVKSRKIKSCKQIIRERRVREEKENSGDEVGNDLKSPNALRPPQPQADDCLLELDSGKYCLSGWVKRWYYDTKKKECISFYYGSCGGNGNNFESAEDCWKTCNLEKYETNLKSSEDYIEDPCKMPIDEGEWCKPPGWLVNYAYSNGACFDFFYGGCKGNSNRFKAKEECEAGCVVTSKGYGTCMRYRDTIEYCEQWINDKEGLCDSSKEVKTGCKRSCCQFKLKQKNEEISSSGVESEDKEKPELVENISRSNKQQ